MIRFAAAVLAVTACAGPVSASPTPQPADPFRPLATAADYAAATGRTGDWGGDGFASVPLADGRRLWMLNDTVTPGGGFRHNSWLTSDGRSFTRGPGNLIPDPSDGSWYWPNNALAQPVTGGTRLLVQVQRVRATGGGGLFGFLAVGAETAEVFVPAGGAPRFVRTWPTPTNGPDTGAVQWNTAAVPGADGWTYVYGTAHVGGYLNGRAVYLARTRDLTAAGWQFRTSTGWTADPAAAAPIVADNPRGWSAQCSIWHDTAGWHALTKIGEGYGHDVSLLTAPNPWGPWAERVVMQAPTTDTAIRYSAHYHGRTRDGLGLVTVNVSPTDPAVIAANPSLQRPEWSGITL